MSYTGTVVVIPTRNRADLVRNAVASVLEQTSGDVSVLVSDNSTSIEQRNKLSRYCEQRGDPRLRYIVPPEALSMTRHWDWVMREALSLYDASHVAFLTDRMMFKPAALSCLLRIVSTYPEKILTYMHDMVDDFSKPVVVRQYTWTGNLYEVPSTRLLELIAESVVYDSAQPRMLNCLVPRDVLETIARHFGNYFDSIAPDWNFASRALFVVDNILFYDKAALVHYAQDRSNGQSANYGITNSAYRDFVQDLGPVPQNFAAPFPEIITVWNAIISEYCHTKNVTQSAKFPDLNLTRYVHALAVGIERIIDPEGRQHMRKLLAARVTAPGIAAA